MKTILIKSCTLTEVFNVFCFITYTNGFETALFHWSVYLPLLYKSSAYPRIAGLLHQTTK